MAWRCPLCGVVNDDSAVRCVRSICKGGRAQVGSVDDANRFTHSELAEMVLAVFVMSSMGLVVMALLPRGTLLEDYGYLGVQCAVIYGLKKRYPFRVFSLGNKSATLICGLGAAAVLFALHCFGHANFPPLAPDDYGLFVHYSVGAKGLYALNMIAFTPFVEETVFRGFIYRVLEARYSPLVGAIVSIGLFAAVHGFSLSSFFLGLVFTEVYRTSGNMWSSIMAHSAHNFAYFVFHYLP